VQGGFAECSGFGSNVEVIEYREGGEPKTVRKLPGKVSYPDISLKWGLTDSRELYDWHLAAVDGPIQRKNGSIILQDDEGQERVRWNFFNAWPSKWDGPDFNAKGTDVAIETLTVSCERVERA
jgi:phage tail-like protein